MENGLVVDLACPIFQNYLEELVEKLTKKINNCLIDNSVTTIEENGHIYCVLNTEDLGFELPKDESEAQEILDYLLEQINDQLLSLSESYDQMKGTISKAEEITEIFPRNGEAYVLVD